MGIVMKFILFAALLSLQLHSQVKIDNLTIPDYEAKDYFLDCYKYPDTLWYQLRPLPEYVPIGERNEDPRRILGELWIKKDNLVKQGIIVPRIPSAEDFKRWQKRQSASLHDLRSDELLQFVQTAVGGKHLPRYENIDTTLIDFKFDGIHWRYHGETEWKDLRYEVPANRCEDYQWKNK
jgi:hypothetical protein